MPSPCANAVKKSLITPNASFSPPFCPPISWKWPPPFPNAKYGMLFSSDKNPTPLYSNRRSLAAYALCLLNFEAFERCILSLALKNSPAFLNSLIAELSAIRTSSAFAHGQIWHTFKRLDKSSFNDDSKALYRLLLPKIAMNSVSVALL